MNVTSASVYSIVALNIKKNVKWSPQHRKKIQYPVVIAKFRKCIPTVPDEKKCRGRGDSARRSRRESSYSSRESSSSRRQTKRHRKRSKDRSSRSSSRSNRDTTPPKTRDENDEECEEALSGSSVLGSIPGITPTLSSFMNRYDSQPPSSLLQQLVQQLPSSSQRTDELDNAVPEVKHKAFERLTEAIAEIQKTILCTMNTK